MEVRSWALFFLLLVFLCLSVSSESQINNLSRSTTAFLPDKKQIHDVRGEAISQKGDDKGNVDAVRVGRGRGISGGGESGRKPAPKTKSAAPVARPSLSLSVVPIFFTAYVFSVSVISLFL